MKYLQLSAFLFWLSLPVLGSAQNSQSALSPSNGPTLSGHGESNGPVQHIPTPASLYPAPTLPPLTDGGIRTPFSHAEEDFYRRAWPIRESHGGYALLLIGVVLLTIIGLLIRKMAQSKPRKPQQ